MNNLLFYNRPLPKSLSKGEGLDSAVKLGVITP